MKTKAINQLTSALLAMFVIIMFAFSACSSDDGGDDPDDPYPSEIELNERVINVDAESTMHFVSVSGVTYTFSTTADSPTILVGDILLGDNDPYGYIRKVTSIISQTSSELVVNTTQANFTDAIKRCDIQETIQLNLGTPDINLPGVQITNNSIKIEDMEMFHIGLPPFNFYADLDEASLKFQDPKLDFKLKIDDGVLSEYSSLYQATTTFTCDLSFDLYASYSYTFPTKNLYKKTVKKTTMIGWFPVIHVITTTVDLNADFNANGGLKTDLNIGFSQDLEIGARYYNSSWQDLNSVEISWNEPTVSMEAYANATLRPYLEIKIVDKLYGIMGPNLRAEPYIEANGTYTYPPHETCLEVLAGVDVGCGFSGCRWLGIGDWNSPGFPIISEPIYPKTCWQF